MKPRSAGYLGRSVPLGNGPTTTCRLMLPAVSYAHEHCGEIAEGDEYQSTRLAARPASDRSASTQGRLAARKVCHCVFVRQDGKTLPVPARADCCRRPIKPIYIKLFLELIEGA